MNIITSILIYIIMVAIVVNGALFYVNYLNRKSLKRGLNALKEKEQEILDNEPKLDFLKDAEFLFYIIDDKIKMAKEYYIKPLNSSNTTLKVNDSNFQEIYENLIFDIISTLSPEYKQVLYKYFTPDSLVSVITDLVFTDLLQATVGLNVSNLNIKRTLDELSRFNRDIGEDEETSSFDAN